MKPSCLKLSMASGEPSAPALWDMETGDGWGVLADSLDENAHSGFKVRLPQKSEVESDNLPEALLWALHMCIGIPTCASVCKYEGTFLN